MGWELSEVPRNPTPSLQDSTVDVVAAKIEPKLANALIWQLSQICPLENLRHVKRVCRRTECGKSELSIILCLSAGSGICSKHLPEDVQKIVDTCQLPSVLLHQKMSGKNNANFGQHPTILHKRHDLLGPLFLPKCIERSNHHQ